MRTPPAVTEWIHRVRPALPWAASAALLVLAFLALQSMVERDDRIADALTAELSRRIEDRVHAWEQRLLPTLDGMITEASSGTARPAALEGRWRAEHPWFDALYVWTIDERPGLNAPPEVDLTFPEAAPPTPDASARACATAWASQDTAPRTTPPADLCPDAEARGWGALELSRGLADDDRPADALALLDTYPARDAELRIQQQLHRATLFDVLGRPGEATELRRRIAFALGGLDAPQLERVLYLMPGVLGALKSRGVDTALLDQRLARAEQRLAAWREIQRAALRPAGRTASVGARFTVDQFSEVPYLLYSRQAVPGRPGVALLLRQDSLLSAFLETLPGLQSDLVVTDITGRRVTGPPDPAEDGPDVPFADTLRHLKVQVSASAMTARLRPVRGVARVWIAVIVGGCILLGIGALWAQNEANRRHRLLLQRQRDFTARVTHELKTPLAGIKVMAENLAIGAYRDDTQRSEWADRIVDEADRLTERVNEVLQLSRQRSVPTPEPFDIDEPLLELVDHWAPRYDQHHVRFLADLAPADEVVGDPIAIRDAVSCLLDNALKYRREDIDSAVWLNVRQEGRWVEVEVVDNGLGVPREQRREIFKPFVRVEGPGRGKSGGHGLGLGQVAEIVKAHRGRVWCDTGIDGGSRFVMRLPTAT